MPEYASPPRGESYSSQKAQYPQRSQNRRNDISYNGEGRTSRTPRSSIPHRPESYRNLKSFRPMHNYSYDYDVPYQNIFDPFNSDERMWQRYPQKHSRDDNFWSRGIKSRKYPSYNQSHNQERVGPYYEFHEHYHNDRIGESSMSDPVNVFAVNPVSGSGMSGGFGGYGGGFGAFPFPVPVNYGSGHGCNDGLGLGGGGLLGGLLVGGLLSGRGFGGFGGGWVGDRGGDCGHGGHGHGASFIQDTAILSKVGDVQGAIPLAACQIGSQLAEQTGDINLATAQQTLALSNQISTGTLANQLGFSNVKDSVQTTAAITNANIAAATAAVNVGTLQTAISIRDDGDKTRALISSIDRDNLNRMLSDANNVIAELKYGREADSRQHGIEIQMINNQNQNQLQFQAQAQGIGFLQHCLNDVGQVAKATNQNVLVGNSGVTATGPQTANPTNVRV